MPAVIRFYKAAFQFVSLQVDLPQLLFSMLKPYVLKYNGYIVYIKGCHIYIVPDISIQTKTTAKSDQIFS